MTESTKEDSRNFKIDHDVTQLNNVIRYPTQLWRAAKKYSVNNTLPIAAVNTWLQFSLAYVAAVMITDSDVSFITSILNSRIVPAYVYASIIFGVILVASLAIKHMNRQEIKDEKSKDGDSPIDEKIRGGKSDEINEIAQNALTIEIVPDLVDKKQGFSIVLPISKKQGEILENKRQENRNKVIFLTVPYVLSGLIVVGALIQNKFSFANVQGWAEWGFIAFVSAIFIAGVCIALSKLKNNEVSNAHNIVKKFNNVDILLPFRSGTIVSVMENKFESKEENDPISRLIKLLDTHLTNFTDKIVDSFDKHLDEVKNSLGKEFLELANANIEKTLDGIGSNIETFFNNLEESIKKDVDEVKKKANSEIAKCSQDISKSIDESLKEIRTDVKEKLNQVKLGKAASWFCTLSPPANNIKPGNTEGTYNDNNHDSSSESADRNVYLDSLGLTQEDRERINRAIHDEVQKALQSMQTQLTELQNSTQNSRTNGSRDNDRRNDNADSLENTVAEQRKKVRDLESQKESRRLAKKQKKLEQESSEQKETDEWEEKINGKPSEFLYYLLESIKLEEKDNKVEATLRNFDNKVTIHWKDGFQTTCHTKKQGDLQIESSATMFTDPNVQAAWEMARGKSL
ncbi:hypothetical protein [Wolbachia endosymbiont (group A) of Lasioglossum fulvicorne]|uniref:hypothetical protein n=1 Tax=Wolbachia endosymbiont (group A) of Lasioglossum fulvicorne TaxID=3066201 RepID=UPI003341F067